jgi:hypothetical protein
MTAAVPFVTGTKYSYWFLTRMALRRTCCASIYEVPQHVVVVVAALNAILPAFDVTPFYQTRSAIRS